MSEPALIVAYSELVTPADETVHASTTNGAFTNQPGGDAVEIVSNSASDTQDATVYGTTNGTDTLVKETITLDGTNVVTTTKTDWGDILGIELSAAAVGTITFREASGNATITTITATNTQKGVESIAVSSQSVGPSTPTIAAAQASTQVVGLVGYDEDDAEVLDAQALAGTTLTLMNSIFDRVTKFLNGDLASGDNVTVSKESASNLREGTCQGLHNAGTAGSIYVTYRHKGSSGERVEDIVYIGQGETVYGNFWRVRQVGTASGSAIHALY